MIFYTPELLERFGSKDDDIADAAIDEVEQRADDYVRHGDAIESKLPPRLRDLLNQFYLHDARVISHPPLMITDVDWLERALRSGLPLGWRVFGPREHRLPSYWIPLELDWPPREALVLQYRWVQIENAELHESLFDECPYLEWLHDEIELVQDGESTEFLHSILFTRGFELQLRFKDFGFAMLKPMEMAKELAGSGTSSAARRSSSQQFILRSRRGEVSALGDRFHVPPSSRAGLFAPTIDQV
jgi:hypothetical protein